VFPLNAFLKVPFVSCPKSFTITNCIPLTTGEAEITENKKLKTYKEKSNNIVSVMNNLPDKDVLDTVSLIAKHLAKVITVVPDASRSTSEADELFKNWRETRRYDHELTFRSKEFIKTGVSMVGVTEYSFAPNAFKALLWFWNNPLYPMYTFTLFWMIPPKNSVSFRAFSPYDSYEWDAFCSRKARVIILRKGRVLVELEIDIPKADPQVWQLTDQTPPIQSVMDREAARSWVEDNIDHARTPKKQLECGWAKRLANEIGLGMSFLNDPANAEQVQKERDQI
jgi:hypothetical protein